MMVEPLLPVPPAPETSALVARLLEHKQLLLAYDAETMLVMAERWVELELMLEAQINLLAMEITEMAATGEVVHLNKLMKLERYQALLGQLDIEVAKYVDWGVLEIIGRERLLGQLGIQHAVEGIQLALVEAGKGVGEFFNRVPMSAVEKMVGMTAGGPLEGLLSEAYPLAAEQMSQALIEGVALGLPPGEVAKRMADGVATGLNRCTVIARTEVLRVYREASREQYEESGAVTGYERLATRQPNTCMACIALDGEVYPTKELMSVHPQDRCTMIPLVRGVPRVKRELAGEWFEKQDPGLQREMMGPGRHELYKEGKVGLPDLVTKTDHPVWGPSVGVTPLKNLV